MNKEERPQLVIALVLFVLLGMSITYIIGDKFRIDTLERDLRRTQQDLELEKHRSKTVSDQWAKILEESNKRAAMWLEQLNKLKGTQKDE